MSPNPPSSPSPPDDDLARSVAPGVRALVEASPPVTLEEVRTRPGSVGSPRPASGARAWRFAAAAAAVLVLVIGGVVWRARHVADPAADRSTIADPLPIPANPTGPAPAANTAASTGEPDRGTTARWDVVRTGADDRQLVVFFDGGGCGTYRAEVTETADAVDVAVLPVPRDDDTDCLMIAGPGAIGVELSAPLGDRRVEGSRPVGGNDVPGPLVVPGSQLATLTWPAGSSRAAAEDLHRGLGPDAYVWTQRFDGPAGDDGAPQTVSLEQWHGATPIDDGAVFQTCRGEAGTTEQVVLRDGTDATVVRCASSDESPPRRGALALLWMDGDDRLMVRADPGNELVDEPALVGLAESVRRGA